jgi:hypothetical protein
VTQDPQEHDLAAFLTELSALTAKHGIEIGGCGCEGSPWLIPITGAPASAIADGLTFDRETGQYTAAP